MKNISKVSSKQDPYKTLFMREGKVDHTLKPILKMPCGKDICGKAQRDVISRVRLHTKKCQLCMVSINMTEEDKKKAQEILSSLGRDDKKILV